MQSAKYWLKINGISYSIRGNKQIFITVKQFLSCSLNMDAPRQLDKDIEVIC